MIEQAVILAAGKGTRLRETDDALPKPLTVVAGQPLIKRTIMTLREAGIRRVTVVTGFMADLVERTLAADSGYASAGVTLTFARNAEFELANGVSVLVGGKATPGPFVLSMADHIYTPTVARLVAGADMTAADLYLPADPPGAEIHDIAEATQGKSDGTRIVEIGKQIPVYDRIDCGVFAVTHELLKMLTEVRAERGDCSLTDGVRKLAAKGRARVVDIGNEKWQDVDTQADREHYEKSLR